MKRVAALLFHNAVSAALAVAILGSLCQPCAAQSLREHHELIDEIFRLDGTEEELRTIKAVFIADLERQIAYGMIPEEERRAHRQAIEIMFGDGQFALDFRHSFSEGFDYEKGREVLGWLRSPSVRRLEQMEDVMSTPEGMGLLNQFLNSPQGRAVPESRIDLLQKFAEETGCAEAHLASFLAMVATRQAVLNRSRAPEERWSKERLVEYLEETREQMREDLANGCWMPQLYVYRQATDAELTQYLEFFESETGRWYLNLGRKASQDAWAAAGLRLGDAGFEYPWEEVKELSKK